MITKALEYLKQNLNAGKVINSSNRDFSLEKLNLIPNKFDEPVPQTLTVNTLTGFCDYIDSGSDEIKNAFIHVENFHSVQLVSGLFGDNHQRKIWIEATIDNTLESGFCFGQFMRIPEFIIDLQAYFAETEDVKKILGLVSNIKAEQGQTYQDNGFAQTVTAKRSTGSSMVESVLVPNPVTLRPFRTFLEIEQPESSFVFRLSSGGEDQPPQCALFEASGGAWKLDAIQKIAAWIRDRRLPFMIIA